MLRLRRPFRSAARRPTLPDVLALIERVYGPEPPHYPGSPYQGTPYDNAEKILHELGHIVQLPSVTFDLGNGERASDDAFRHLRELPKEEADVHEVGAVAITLGVARALRIPFARWTLVQSGVRNSRVQRLVGNPGERFDRALGELEKTERAHGGVQQILDILDREWGASGPAPV